VADDSALLSNSETRHAVSFVVAMRVDDRDGDLCCPLEEARDESLVELADDDGMVLRGLPKRAEPSHELVFTRLGLDLEADAHQRLGDGDCCCFVAGFVGESDLCSKLASVLATDLVGDLRSVLGSDAFDDAKKEFGEKVVASRRELHRHVLAGGFVVLRWTTCTRTRPSRRSPSGDLEVSVGDESVEVMASHVRMDIEQIGNLRGGYGLERLANRDVDPATSRVAECGGEVGDLLIKRFGIHAVPVEILDDRSSL